MTLPNFLIVGAAKSGTTALYHYLKQHPEVYMSPNKEPNFFALEGQEVQFRGPGDEKMVESTITNLEAYEEQFEGVTDEIAIGEASPWYLYCPSAAESIRRRIPNVKIIAILRNPVDRAFSSYLHVLRDGRETLDFEDGLRAEKERVEAGWEYIWHYRRVGFYARQVERFLRLFSSEQVRFYLYDDFLSDPPTFLADVYEFLGVDPNIAVDTSLKPNATGVPKNQVLGRLLLRPNPVKAVAKRLLPEKARYEVGQRIYRRLLHKPSLEAEVREKLLEDYAEDISSLRKLIDCDLTAWTGR